MVDSGEVQNFVGIHPTQEAVHGIQSGSSAEVKDSMVQEFSHFHPDIVNIFRFALPTSSTTIFSDRSTAQQKTLSGGRFLFMIPCRVGNLVKYC